MGATDMENGRRRKNKKPEGCIKATWDHFVEYSENCTFDGVRYLGDRTLHKVEKIFWIIVFICSISISIYLIADLYIKWKNSPVIVSFNERSKPTWKIPFPAVTICPETKNYKKDVNFTDIYNKLSKNESLDGISGETMKNFEALAHVCNPELFEDQEFEFPSTGLESSEIRKRLMNVSLNLEDVFVKCMVLKTEVDCIDFFEPVMTADGLCYSFNMIDLETIYNEKGYESMRLPNDTSEDSGETNEKVDNDEMKEKKVQWTLDDGYLDDDLEAEPMRVLGSGLTAGLIFTLKANDEDMDYVCRGTSQGFKLLLHPPNELPNTKNYYIRIPLKQDLMVHMKPKMMETSEELINYTPDERQCFFNHESKLEFFKTYTKTNCAIECTTKYQKHFCGCVHMSMPHDNETRICGLDEIECLGAAKKNHILLEMGAKTKELEEFYKDKPVCKCLSSCSFINYEAEVTQNDYQFRKVQRAFGKEVEKDSRTDGFKGEVMSKVTIFFGDDELISSKRSELYGLTDFIANCGGLIGLFIGGSVISLVEIFFYVSMRPIFKGRVENDDSDEDDEDEPSEKQQMNVRESEK